MRLLWTAVLLVELGATGGMAQDPRPVVKEIEVRFQGPETVNRAVVLANIQTKVGEPRVREIVEEDVRTLIGTGFFFDVRVLEEPAGEGLKVIYQVQGKAILKEIEFEGNTKFKDDRLKREVTVKVGEAFDEYKTHGDIAKIVEMYQKTGYPDVKVEREVNIDRDTSRAILRFKITEGPRVFLKRIEFAGVDKSRKKALLKLMKTRHRWWGSWLSGTGVKRDEQYSEDLEKIVEYYRGLGFIDMEIRSTREERITPTWMVLHIEIYEGSQYKVGSVQVKGIKIFPAAVVEKRLTMTTDKIFTPDGLMRDVKALEDYYGERGYLDTTVRSEKAANVQTGRIDLTYTVREGELTYIEKIEIRGNTKTKDKVIRRELAVMPGEIYNTVKIDRSAERLRNLGYFARVDTMPLPTDVQNRKDLTIQVEEQRTGSFTFGAGFSSIDNLVGFVEVTQGNFDLFNWPNFTGGGQKLRLRLQVGTERQDYILAFTEPWFLDKKLSLGFDLFHRTSSFLSGEFEETRTGGALRLEKAITGFLRTELQYSLQKIRLEVEPDASNELKAEDGSDVRSGLQATFSYDTRDSLFLTLRGNRTEISAEGVGGPLGGDVDIYKLTAKTTFYFPFFNKHVLQLIGATGVAAAYGDTKGSAPTVVDKKGNKTRVVKVNDVPIYDRYFLGGANTMRGFEYRMVGPKDIDEEPVGGDTYILGTIEYTFPIVERIRGAFFFDIGNVWRDAYEYDFSDLKSDAGVGLRMNLPIGPIRLDYGYPIQTDDKSGRSGQFQFSVGYQF